MQQRFEQQLAEVKGASAATEGDLKTARDELVAQKRARAAALIRRWGHMSLVPVFLQWRQVARDRKQRKLDLMSKILKRMDANDLWHAMRQWEQFADASQRADMQATFEKHLADVKAGQSSAEDTAKAVRDALVVERRKRAHALIESWQHLSLVPAFKQWRAVVQQRKTRRLELTEKMLNRLADAQLWHAWRTWTQFTQATQVAELRAKLSTVREGASAAVRALVARFTSHFVVYSAGPDADQD